ncbi:hypothetical protein JG687_00016577, partial [Phytophthora cactorum]
MNQLAAKMKCAHFQRLSRSCLYKPSGPLRVCTDAEPKVCNRPPLVSRPRS